MKIVLVFLISIFFQITSSAQAKLSRRDIKKVKQQLEVLQGVTAPDFALLDSSNTKFQLSDFSEKVVILDFWTTYCAPCIHDIPDYKKNKLFYKDTPGVVFIGICVDKLENIPRWKSLLNKHEQSGIQLFLPTSGDTLKANAFYSDNIQSFPTYLLVSKEAIILGSLPNVESGLMPYVIDNGQKNKTTANSMEDALINSESFKEWFSTNSVAFIGLVQSLNEKEGN